MKIVHFAIFVTYVTRCRAAA